VILSIVVQCMVQHTWCGTCAETRLEATKGAHLNDFRLRLVDGVRLLLAGALPEVVKLCVQPQVLVLHSRQQAAHEHEMLICALACHFLLASQPSLKVKASTASQGQIIRTAHSTAGEVCIIAQTPPARPLSAPGPLPAVHRRHLPWLKTPSTECQLPPRCDPAAVAQSQTSRNVLLQCRQYA
jgi:hypothetical protein